MRHNYRYFYAGQIVQVGAIQFMVDGYFIVNDELIGGVLMQSTGLKDKNGNFIYEGDIIKTAFGSHDENGYGCYFEEVGIVEMHWNSFVPTKIVSFCTMYNYQIYAHSQVIGNIYENPELLNK